MPAASAAPASMARPNAGPTPIRTVRVEDELWVRAQIRAAKNGDTLSDVIRDALEAYVK